MNDNKRYYWIKLKTDFFNQETIDFLLSQKNGCEYIVLYQMLCLNTANNNGEMCSKIGEMIVPYNVDKIVRDTKYFDFDTVTIALGLFKQLGLIYEEKDKILKITNFNEMVGSEASNSNAQRQKRFRERQKQLKLSVTDSNVDSNAKNNEEIDIDIRDRDKSIDKDIDNINNKPVDTSCIQNGDIDKEEEKPHKDTNKKETYGTYGRIKLTISEYLRLREEFGEDFINKQIELLDEYVEMNNNKNKYNNFNLVLRKSIRENWFKDKKIERKGNNVFLDIMKDDYESN